jgi:hypothetical protein
VSIARAPGRAFAADRLPPPSCETARAERDVIYALLAYAIFEADWDTTLADDHGYGSRTLQEELKKLIR